MVLESIYTAAGLLWKAFWALALGYAFSAVIQVFISRHAAAKNLGKGSAIQLAKSGILGFISSSCSFAALSSTKSLFVKGASLTSSLAYMFASTNLAVEVAILAYIFLGWQYSLALFIGAPILIFVQTILVRLICPSRLIEKARKNARKVSGHDMDPSDGLHNTLGKKIIDKKTWIRVGASYLGEWKMVYKEILIGFLIAGIVATTVPQSFFQGLFPMGDNFVALVFQSIIAPFLAIITVIGSMGNGPLAAVLANNGIMFGSIMVFLYSDFNVPPALRINAKYYGWKFASYIAVITALSAIITGILVHLLFQSFGILPESVIDIKNLATFSIDYTFFLNIFAFLIGIILLRLARKSKMKMHDH